MILEIRNIYKKFGKKEVLNDISFSADKGELITLLGPNGAGKTTLIRIISGNLLQDSGSVTHEDKNFCDNRLEILNHIGYMPENIPLYPEFCVYEYLKFVAAAYKMSAPEFDSALAEVVKGLEIEAVINQKIQTLSKGYKRRVALAATILHHPKLLILDEPTEGLDPNQKISIRRFLKKYAQDNLVLISTHLLEETEALNARVLLLSQGKICCDGSVAKMRQFADDGTLSSAFYNLTKGHIADEELK